MAGLRPADFTALCSHVCPSMEALRSGRLPRQSEVAVVGASGERKELSVTPVIISGLSDDASRDCSSIYGAADWRRTFAGWRSSARRFSNPLTPPDAPDELASTDVAEGAPRLTARELEVLRLGIHGLGDLSHCQRVEYKPAHGIESYPTFPSETQCAEQAGCSGYRNPFGHLTPQASDFTLAFCRWRFGDAVGVKFEPARSPGDDHGDVGPGFAAGSVQFRGPNRAGGLVAPYGDGGFAYGGVDHVAGGQPWVGPGGSDVADDYSNHVVLAGSFVPEKAATDALRSGPLFLDGPSPTHARSSTGMALD